MTAETGGTPPLAPKDNSVRFTLEEAMATAIRWHQERKFGPAAGIYEAILAKKPDHAEALHFFGLLKHHAGKIGEGLSEIEASLKLAPEAPGYWNNYGNVLVENERFDEAIDAFQRCIELAPDFADAYCNLGVVQRGRGHLQIAETCYNKAIELRPDFYEAFSNLANLRLAQRRINDAVLLGLKMMVMRPDTSAHKRLLGIAYAMLGEREKALELFRQWVSEEPDNPVSKHHLAAIEGENVPDRASDGYVAMTFDAFAASFDSKLAGLDYRAPELVAEAVAALYPKAGKVLDIIDAGCGTGLCGPKLEPYAAKLIGVDLSEKMVDRAKKRDCYDFLAVMELTLFLRQMKGGADLIVSADTLCYFGVLSEVFAASFDSLRPGGGFVFTVEKNTRTDEGYVLYLHGRYGHKREFVESELERAGFERMELAEVVLRQEGGLPVSGYLVTARKPL